MNDTNQIAWCQNTVYVIDQWADLFETADSRRYKSLSWIRWPVAFSSRGYDVMLAEFGDEAPIVYGGWAALCQIAAVAPERGTLAFGNGQPYPARYLSRQSGFPLDCFHTLLDWAVRVGWLVATQSPPSEQPAATDCLPSYVTERNVTKRDGTEPDETETEREEALPADHQAGDAIVEAWNATMGQSARLTDKRQAMIRTRLSDPWWRDNWPEAIERAEHSQFLRGNNERGWTADLSWFLKPDSANSIIEGKYDDKQSVNRTRVAQREHQNADAFAIIRAGNPESAAIAECNGQS